jgi:hypothetical protein
MSDYRRYRVWGCTEVSPVSPVYEGYVDVYAADADEAEDLAQRQIRKMYEGRSFHIQRIEVQPRGH